MDRCSRGAFDEVLTSRRLPLVRTANLSDTRTHGFCSQGLAWSLVMVATWGPRLVNSSSRHYVISQSCGPDVILSLPCIEKHSRAFWACSETFGLGNSSNHRGFQNLKNRLCFLLRLESLTLDRSPYTKKCSFVGFDKPLRGGLVPPYDTNGPAVVL